MLTLTDLNECFQQAKEVGAKFFAVRINVGLNKEEVIINPYVNFDEKQAYYNQTYAENLRHKFAENQGIRITAYAYADSFEDIERQLTLYDVTGNVLI